VASVPLPRVIAAVPVPPVPQVPVPAPPAGDAGPAHFLPVASLREVLGAHPAGLGRSYQDARLYPTLTVWDTLRTASELHVRRAGWAGVVPGLPAERRAERSADERASNVVEMLGLGRYAGKFVRELSTGTRRIVDLGCLLIQRPSLILFDEPSSGIAQREAEALGPLLKVIRDETGAALLVIEHDMPLLLGMTDRLYALETGRVIAHGDPMGVVAHPRVVASYLGDNVAAINRSGAAQRHVDSG